MTAIETQVGTGFPEFRNILSKNRIEISMPIVVAIYFILYSVLRIQRKATLKIDASGLKQIFRR